MHENTRNRRQPRVASNSASLSPYTYSEEQTQSPFHPQTDVYIPTYPAADDTSLWIVHCGEPNCSYESLPQLASAFTFIPEEIRLSEFILCNGCLSAYPDIPTGQQFPVFRQTTPQEQMIRIPCIESTCFANTMLNVTDEESFMFWIPPRSPFAKAMWSQPRMRGGNVYRCPLDPFCMRQFDKKSKYVRHVAGHLKLYECNLCSYKSGRWEDMRKHITETQLHSFSVNQVQGDYDQDISSSLHFSRFCRQLTQDELLQKSQEAFSSFYLAHPPLHPLLTQVTVPDTPQAAYTLPEDAPWEPDLSAYYGEFSSSTWDSQDSSPGF